MEELKIKVDAFISKYNELYIRESRESRESICSCEYYSPYTANGSCRFCYRFNKVNNDMD
jgi:hypothetical protein